MELICGFISMVLSIVFAYGCDAAAAANSTGMPPVIFGLSAVGFALISFVFFARFIWKMFD